MRTNLICAFLMLAASSAFAVPPVNDEWSSAIVFTPAQLSAGFANSQEVSEATTNLGTDPEIQCKAGDPQQRGNSIWYKTTTGATPVYLRATSGIQFNSVMVVLTGSPGSFVPVVGGCNDDGDANFGAKIDGLRLEANTTYSIMVARGSNDSIQPANVAFTAGLANVQRVTKTADTFDGVCDADCSLREAVQASSGGAIELPAGDYTLTRIGSDNTNASGDLDLTRNVFFYGLGATQTTVSTTLGERLFDIDPSSTDLGPTISFNDMTLRGGNPFSNGGCINSTASAGLFSANEFIVLNNVLVTNCTTQLNGGALNSPASPVHVYQSTIKDNVAASSGGGIFFGQPTGASDARALIERSTITNNAANSSFASGGGGIMTSGRLFVVASTIHGNRAKFSGGGILVTTFNGTLNMRDATVAGNTADSDNNASGTGGGIRFDQSTTSATAYQMRNSVLANNLTGIVAQDCHATTTGVVFGSASNWVQTNDPSCPFSVSDVVNQAAQLSTVLANSGGPTDALAPLTGSGLIDSGIGCLAKDQRGGTRPLDGDGNGSAICDRGAIELGVLQLPIIFKSGFED